ncbi:MAG: class I adenylate-forming enzyme family protein [Pseudomonadota bacterium]
MQSFPYAPSVFGILQAHARLHPHEAAVISPRGAISYRDLCQHIDRVTRHLSSFELPAGSRVVISATNGYYRWMLYVALARLGMVSVVSPMLDLAKPVAVVTDQPGTSGSFREILIKDSWMSAAADALPPFQEPRHPADDHCTIVLSSGTTGTPKLAPFSYAQVNERIRATIVSYSVSNSTRMLATVGMSTIGGLILPLAAWYSGGAVILAPAEDAGFMRFRPTIMFVSTAQLGGFAKSLGPDRTPIQPPTIFVAGSVLPRQVNLGARLRFGAAIMMVYGSTEVGTVTLAPAAHTDAMPALTGYVMPHAEVEIVDPQGKPVPHGTVGEVRVRTPGQVELYLDDPKTSAATFHDGWFHPGDMGVLGRKGDLSIVGRVNELMNFSGVKLAPHAVEEALGNIHGVSDLAVFSLSGPQGERPCIAVVPTSGMFGQDELAAKFQKAYPLLPKVTVFQVARIPRNDMGKVMRSQLALEATSGGGDRAPTVH